MHYFDAEQAVDQSETDADVYVRRLPDCGDLTERIVRLSQSLNGLKQVARSWHRFLASTLQKYGFERHDSEECLLHLLNTKTGDVRMLLSVCVGD